MGGGGTVRILVFAGDTELLGELLRTVSAAEPGAAVTGVSERAAALDCAGEGHIDVLLASAACGAGDTELARELSALCPGLNIIFVSSDGALAPEAMEMHASGYVVGKLTAERLSAELSDLRYPVPQADGPLLTFRCFGNFEVFGPDGRPVHFERRKSKEMLAYTVFRRGASCSIREIAAALFEDKPYDHCQQVYLQKIASSLMKTLRQYGAEKAVVKTYNSIAIDTGAVDCDYYSYLENSPEVLRTYSGEFMSQYPWAEFIVGYLDRISEGGHGF